jgi:predicted metal-dependent phosphoesterase TrpH
MKTFRADLHIHTVLSPCADLEMSPRNIVARAKETGLDII